MLTITIARKPLDGTVAANALTWGAGGLNIDACRIAAGSRPLLQNAGKNMRLDGDPWGRKGGSTCLGTTEVGRWPANLILCPEAAEGLDRQSGIIKSGVMKGGQQRKVSKGDGGYHGGFPNEATRQDTYGDEGGASRFFKQVGKCS